MDITARWRGHFTEEKSYEAGVTLDGAVEAAFEVLEEHEQASGDYAVLGREEDPVWCTGTSANVLRGVRR